MLNQCLFRLLIVISAQTPDHFLLLHSFQWRGKSLRSSYVVNFFSFSKYQISDIRNNPHLYLVRNCCVK